MLGTSTPATAALPLLGSMESSRSVRLRERLAVGAIANASRILPASAPLCRSSGDSPRGLDPRRASGDAQRAALAASGGVMSAPLRSSGSAEELLRRLPARAKPSCSDSDAEGASRREISFDAAADDRRLARLCPGDAVAKVLWQADLPDGDVFD